MTMLWLTLYNKLGKQPLRITRHNHVHAVIDGKTIDLDLKFDQTGKPYLAHREVKPPKPYKKVYWYTVSEERPEILGSGSQTIWSELHWTEKEAMEALKAKGGNDLRRQVKDMEDNSRIQWYDFTNKCWKDDRDNPLPY